MRVDLCHAAPAGTEACVGAHGYLCVCVEACVCVCVCVRASPHRDAQQHGVHRLSEGQRLWVLAVQSLQGGHEGLPQLLGLEDWRRGGEVGQGRRDRLEVRQAGG